MVDEGRIGTFRVISQVLETSLDLGFDFFVIGHFVHGGLGFFDDTERQSSIEVVNQLWDVVSTQSLLKKEMSRAYLLHR